LRDLLPYSGNGTTLQVTCPPFQPAFNPGWQWSPYIVSVKSTCILYPLYISKLYLISAACSCPPAISFVMIQGMKKNRHQAPRTTTRAALRPTGGSPESDRLDMDRLLAIMARLRDPQNGCPWDRQQDFTSIAPYTVEEAYEVADAIAENNMPHLKEELGDLLFQVVFHSQMAKERGHFDFTEVVRALNEKMIERHPHVFDPNHPPVSAAEQTRAWERRKHADKNSVLDDIPTHVPGLSRAVKLQKRAASIGFDWPDVEPVFDKLDEEVAELKEAMRSGDKSRMQDELGDVLFVITNLARHLGVDPELALRQANNKFEKRFRAVEKLAREAEPESRCHSLQQLDRWWDEVKQQEHTKPSTPSPEEKPC